MIALMGRRDVPADGVEDYCAMLGQALTRRGIALQAVRVPWEEKGGWWALRELSHKSVTWRGEWVLVQYTALGWSRRGFPLGILLALWILRRRGVQCAVVFHEPFGLTGPRWIDRIRFSCQQAVVRLSHRGALKCFFTLPLKLIRWLPTGDQKATFIPIGANIPEAPPWNANSTFESGSRKTVAVFCLTVGPNRFREVADIAHAVLYSQSRGAELQLVFLGKGTAEMREEIESTFDGSGLKVSVLGLLPAAEVTRLLLASDVLLCVRGELTPRRGSAIAGIACGLPIVAYTGPETVFPITEAGVELVPLWNRSALAEGLNRVLADDRLRCDLRRKSQLAWRNYFCWDAIAGSYLQALGCGSAEK